ncbi:MAG: ribonuclease P protein component [Leptospiraceae bacterium]|nr:ribonuclease P protein component [Leptospiraceae bacterium]
MGIARFRKQVLKNRSWIQRLFTRGRRQQCHCITVVFLNQQETEASQFLIAVGKRIGSAVERNRVKRVLREGLDQCLVSIRPGYWVALVPDRRFLQTPSSRSHAELMRCLQKSGLWQA